LERATCYRAKSRAAATSTFSPCGRDLPKNKFVCAALRNETTRDDLQCTGMFR
jgi:hypothetical protein